MEIMSDRIIDGCPFRILTVVDGNTREALKLLSPTPDHSSVRPLTTQFTRNR